MPLLKLRLPDVIISLISYLTALGNRVSNCLQILKTRKCHGNREQVRDFNIGGWKFAIFGNLLCGKTSVPSMPNNQVSVWLWRRIIFNHFQLIEQLAHEKRAWCLKKKGSHVSHYSKNVRFQFDVFKIVNVECKLIVLVRKTLGKSRIFFLLSL